MFSKTKSKKRILFEAATNQVPIPSMPGAAFDPLPLYGVSIAMFFVGLFLRFKNLNLRNTLQNKNFNTGDCDFLRRPLTETCDEINTKMLRNNGQISNAENAIFTFEIMIGISLILLAGLILRARYIAAKNKPHLHHIIARDFYEKNPAYPKDKNATIAIKCPISREKSKQAVCLSYKYKGRLCEHAYDYEELKKFFLTKQGTLCPLNAINLLDPNVSEFKISFDVPENIPERVFKQTFRPKKR